MVEYSIPILGDKRVLAHALVIVTDQGVLFTFIVFNYELVKQTYVLFSLYVGIKAFINIHSILGMALTAKSFCDLAE